MGILMYVFIALIALGILCLLLFVIIRAAIRSAMNDSYRGAGHQTQLLATQADLTARLAKHLIAQTDLMILAARHDGISDAALEPVLAQVAEHKAGMPAEFKLPFS